MNLQMALNQYLANLIILAFKTYQLGWHVSGTHATAVQNFSNTLYVDLFRAYTKLAKLMLLSNHAPIATLADFTRVSTLMELPNPVTDPLTATEIICQDLTQMKTLASIILDQSENDLSLASFMESQMVFLSKHVYFLKSICFNI